jgi:uncharacterized membrane protein
MANYILCGWLVYISSMISSAFAQAESIDPYNTPYYSMYTGLAILICFVPLIIFIIVVNVVGFSLSVGRSAAANRSRTAQI